MKSSLIKKLLGLFFVMCSTAHVAAQEVHNDTLFIYGEDIQKVELNNRATSERIRLQEVDFGYYVHPLTHSQKGVYTLSIFRDRKRYVSTVEDSVEYNPTKMDFVDKYYYLIRKGKWSRVGYCGKAQAVLFIEENLIDAMSFNGKNNNLKLYQIKNGKKELVYETN